MNLQVPFKQKLWFIDKTHKIVFGPGRQLFSVVLFCFETKHYHSMVRKKNRHCLAYICCIIIYALVDHTKQLLSHHSPNGFFVKSVCVCVCVCVCV